MKKLISILIILVMTVASQGPTITQTAQFVIGSVYAHDIKFWGDDVIASRYSFETGTPLPYCEELVLLNKLGEVIWRQEFPPAGSGQRAHLAIKGEFCIFTVGDSAYKINKAGTIVKKIFVPTENVSLGAQKQEDELVFIEGKISSSQSKFFVYNEELDFIRAISGQPGGTHSVSKFRETYFVSGTKYGNGVATNLSSHIAKYDTTGSLLWVRQFPDVFFTHLVVNRERLYFCGIDITYSYQRVIYGELEKDSGDTLWTKLWGASYPTTFTVLVSCNQIVASPGGGFAIFGAITAPGQPWGDYDPNQQVGLALGYSPDLNYLWTKTTNDLGGLSSGDWKDSSLIVLGSLGAFTTAAKGIIYSVSGLTAIEDDELGPNSLSLCQNYPNPFNPSTKIKFSIPETGLTSLKIYDLLGREVSVLVNEDLLAGNYEVYFEASSLANGIYIYTLRAGRHTESRKMTLLR